MSWKKCVSKTPFCTITKKEKEMENREQRNTFDWFSNFIRPSRILCISLNPLFTIIKFIPKKTVRFHIFQMWSLKRVCEISYKFINTCSKFFFFILLWICIKKLWSKSTFIINNSVSYNSTSSAITSDILNAWTIRCCFFVSYQIIFFSLPVLLLLFVILQTLLNLARKRIKCTWFSNSLQRRFTFKARCFKKKKQRLIYSSSKPIKNWTHYRFMYSPPTYVWSLQDWNVN